MPFAYFGSKHGLARFYPAPMYRTIIEPFAGSAAYSVHHRVGHHVVLMERDPELFEIWRLLQRMTPEDLAEIEYQLTQQRGTHPLISFVAGGQGIAALGGVDFKVTNRMRNDWPFIRRRIVAALGYVRTWDISNGSYEDLDNREATWFVDPPYQPHDTAAGDTYRYGADQIDFEALGEWCRSRRGQVIVCEQEPANWLPFRPFRVQQAGAAQLGVSANRTEVIWTKQPARRRR